ncbi:Ribonuclease H-like protein [Gracilaria domingensis]|nr:Ribonuclease H-like protein [Gracilaria domingensis]
MEFGDVDEDNSSAPLTLGDEIENQIQSFLSTARVRPSHLPARKLLDWSSTKAKQFPRLAPVARSILEHPSSSAQIERNFGAAGSLLSSKRNRMDSTFVDICLLPHSNIDDVPSNIPCNKDGSWKEHISKLFTAADELADNLLHDAMRVSQVEDIALFEQFDV